MTQLLSLIDRLARVLCDSALEVQVAGEPESWRELAECFRRVHTLHQRGWRALAEEARRRGACVESDSAAAYLRGRLEAAERQARALNAKWGVTPKE